MLDLRKRSTWSLQRKLGSSKELQSLRVLKVGVFEETWIFKRASIFEGVLKVGVFEESLYLGRSFNLRGYLRGWSTSGVEETLFLGRIPSRPSGVKNFQPLQMKRTPLFIEFPGGFHGLGSNSTVSDPTSTGGRSSFCRQIHCPSRSDQAPSSFGGVILPSAIQLLSGDDRLLPSDPPSW
ncbi:hypothetical protein E5676_scaffold45G00830 [Cucumis melo var. makuwa]|uniref:Uncharacterized protein n=1 Tax=Cucumis melo var. makuwa TaxID=1194695 RepID=A0A5D3CXT9_CUCMM|nr:hypothetical protein E5676_scaffold45G00830 [Cucumis melo var. makuwa]